jgi:hypothetical protein
MSNVGKYVMMRNRLFRLISDEGLPAVGEQWSFVPTPSDMPAAPSGTLWEPQEPYMEGKIKDESATLSFDLDNQAWVCEHDYYPNGYVAWGDTLLNFWGNKLYQQNVPLKNGEYHRPVVFPCFVDFVISDPPGITKRLVALEWHTEIIEYSNLEHSDTLKTFDQVMVYNRQQCSGFVPLTTANTKRVENKWRMSQFRDIILDRNQAFLDKRGNLISSNINPEPSWFAKRYFVDEFFIVRLLFANTEKKILYLYSIAPKLLQSDL